MIKIHGLRAGALTRAMQNVENGGRVVAEGMAAHKGGGFTLDISTSRKILILGPGALPGVGEAVSKAARPAFQ